MILCFDFDGTLVDVSNRYYFIYSSFVLAAGRPPISKPAYLRAIRSGRKNFEIFDRHHNRSLYERYIQYRNSLLETQQSLKFDQIIDGIPNVLATLTSRHQLVIMSARDSKPELEKQLDWLNLRPFFDAVYVSGLFNGAVGKSQFLAALNPEVVIGDTEVDVETANMLGLPCISVSWGLRNKSFLKRSGATCILEKPIQLLHALKKTTFMKA